MTGVIGRAYLFAGFVSENIWGKLSGPVQLGISSLIARFYETRLSRFLIRPYCWLHYGNSKHYLNYRPGNGAKRYRTFQDYFTRELQQPPQIKSNAVWPCEGYLCEAGKVEEISEVSVKGETRQIHTVFGKEPSEINKDHFFSNVFLHNNNYHHIHAPATGKISRIQHIPGELLLLRPWAYKNKPSLPALTNERINVDIIDQQGRSWLLSIVGGPLVATIKLPDWLKLGADVEIGSKIATFELGSTCCVIGPESPATPVGQMVDMGSPMGYTSPQPVSKPLVMAQ